MNCDQVNEADSRGTSCRAARPGGASRRAGRVYANIAFRVVLRYRLISLDQVARDGHVGSEDHSGSANDGAGCANVKDRYSHAAHCVLEV